MQPLYAKQYYENASQMLLTEPISCSSTVNSSSESSFGYSTEQTIPSEYVDSNVYNVLTIGNQQVSDLFKIFLKL